VRPRLHDRPESDTGRFGVAYAVSANARRLFGLGESIALLGRRAMPLRPAPTAARHCGRYGL
jgi:hypothetical protein